MKNNRQIVGISTHYWADAWFRKQHFLSRFHKKGWRVAYVEPSFSMARRPEPASEESAKNQFFKVTSREIEKDLFIITPPRLLPFYTRPPVSPLNYLLVSWMVSRELKKLGFEKYSLFVYEPAYAPAISLFDYRRLITEIVDDLPAYNSRNPGKAAYLAGCLEKLARVSDRLIVTAATLKEKFIKLNPRTYLIPNGYDADLFPAGGQEMPEDLKNIPRPLVGFVGTLFHFLDFDLLEYLFAEHPDKSFVFVGPCQSGVQEIWDKLVKKYRNVYWLGRKPKEKIPSYVDFFDVCLNPFKADDVSRSVSPLKVFEYLAAHKPVVSVSMESLMKEKIAGLIDFAGSRAEFSEKIVQVLKHPRRPEEYQIVNDYSWDNLFKKVEDLVNADG